MTHRNRPTITLLACLTTAASLTACGPASPEAGQPNTAPPSASSSSSPATTPGAPASSPASTGGPPARPAAAHGLTLAAAEAFYRYYIDLKNYAAATGDTAALLAASETGCEGCSDYASYVAKVNVANGGISGDYRERIKEITQLNRGSTGRVGGSAVIAVGNFTTKNSPTSSPIISKPAEYTDTIALSAKGQDWVMYEMLFEAR